MTEQDISLVGKFKPFPKIARLTGKIRVTEKIDGTNAQILIENGNVYTGSRNRWITPDNDNFGFAKWVNDNLEDIKKLGEGRFFGEWWGQGIQRGYGLTEKRFTLFANQRIEALPECMINKTPFIPVVYAGPNFGDTLKDIMDKLKSEGSLAAPGFLDPEGIVIYHIDTGAVFKKTYDYDETGKGNNR